MPYVITVVPVMPLRAEPSHRSEMISQALWGECAEIIATGTDGWVKVKCQFDQYEGWVTANHLEFIDENLFKASNMQFTGNWVNKIIVDQKPVLVPFGCLLKPDTKWGKHLIQFEDQPFELADSVASDNKAVLIAERAKLYLNTAYLWGGKTVYGVDCSGLTQTVFKTVGVSLLRDAYQQATQGHTVDFLQEAKLGDLAFFDNAEGRITHVGILLNDHEIIHASGKVRIDPIDNQGITNIDTGVRTHQLRIIRRLL
jgi:gamma-D-glutamyl-L-lysine dipeptidyl-peptidase